MRTLDDLTDAARRIDPTRFSLDDIPALENFVGTPVSTEGAGDDIARVRLNLQAKLNEHYWQYVGRTLIFGTPADFADSLKHERIPTVADYKRKMEMLISSADRIISILGIEETLHEGLSVSGSIPVCHTHGYGIFNVNRNEIIYDEFVKLSDSVYKLRRLAQNKVDLLNANGPGSRPSMRDLALEELYVNLRNTYTFWWKANPTVSVNKNVGSPPKGGPLVRFIQFCAGKILERDIKAQSVKDLLRSIDKNSSFSPPSI